MDIDPTWPEWVLRQRITSVFVRAPSPAAAVEIAAKRLGHMGGWKIGPDGDQEVLPVGRVPGVRETGNYTWSVILGSRS